MEILVHILTALITLEHFYILYLEMFIIESKSGVRQSRVIQRLFGSRDYFWLCHQPNFGDLFLFRLCDYRRSFWGGYDEE